MAKKPLAPDQKRKRPRNAAEEKKNFQADLKARIDSYQEVVETDGFLQRRNIRTALGVGDLKKWAEEYQNGYGGTTDYYIKQPANPQMPYEKFKDEAPVIKKVNTEKPRKLIQPGKERGKSDGKGGGK